MGGTVGLINLTDGAVLSEDDLVTRAGEGDRSAFGALYLRHRDAARRAAGACTSSAADAEDAVAEGFARVFAALPRLAGRPIAFRAYLLTCVRNAATDRLRRERRIDLRESVPEERVVLESASDTALAGVERNLVGEAMQALPRRWRTVLWLTEVEGMTPAQVSSQIGIKPNAVAALAYRARRGLRDAYLQAHLRQETTEGCRATVSRLGVFVRGDLVERERDLVVSHLEQCGKCRSRREELTDVNATIRAAFLPVPLLLAGLKGRWLDVLGRTGALGRSPVEVAQLGAFGDSPIVHKAVAGIAALLMAVSAHGGARLGGSDDAIQAAPVTVVDTAGSAFDFAVLPSDHLGGSVLQDSGASPSVLMGESSGEAGRGGSAASVASPTGQGASGGPAGRGLSGGTQSRFRGRDGDSPQPDKGDGDQLGSWIGDGRDGEGDHLLGVEALLGTVTGLSDEILDDVLGSLPLFADPGEAGDGAEAGVPTGADVSNGDSGAGTTELIEGLADDLGDVLPSSDVLTAQALARVEEHSVEEYSVEEYSVEEYSVSVRERLADAKAAALAAANRAMSAVSEEN